MNKYLMGFFSTSLFFLIPILLIAGCFEEISLTWFIVLLVIEVMMWVGTALVFANLFDKYENGFTYREKVLEAEKKFLEEKLKSSMEKLFYLKTKYRLNKKDSKEIEELINSISGKIED